MKFELDEFHHGVTDIELIADLKRVASELKNNTVNITDYKRCGKYGKTTYIRRFGSWLGALEKAGLERSRAGRYLSEEYLFKNLEEVWIRLGRQPRYDDIQKPLSKYSMRVYLNRFSGWRNTLEKFISYMSGADASLETSIENLRVESSSRHKTPRIVNWRLRFVVMKRDNFKCKNCGRSPATDPNIILHVDHINAWANGGETILENLQTLCSKCNIGKSNL